VDAPVQITRNIIEEIIQRNDISDVVGSYVKLQRAGSNSKGLCPFHSEKTPSFTVFPATASFYCFGCGAGGDVITFIMKAENLDYPGAVEFLANRAGIRIPVVNDITRREEMPRKRVYEINLEAAKFFRKCLNDPSIGGEGLRYLTEVRRLSQTTIKHFGLGFAPNSFSMLRDYMRSLGYTYEELKECYLLGKNETTGKYHDLFRNRVMFPIIDTSGNIIAFGGRVMDDSKPKYLNSSDTPGFKKSRNLFALNIAKGFCSESMILCEGYMDVIALHAAGFENAVATLGTAITSEQARIMARYTKKVIISYDSDEAGQKAADKAMRLLGDVGLEVRVLKLPDAKDPDEYIKKFGRDRFKAELDGSKTGFEHKFYNIIAKYDTGTAEGKIKAAADICSVISYAGQSVERDVYISFAAEKLGLSAESMKNDVEKLRRKQMLEYRQKEGKEAVNAAKFYGDKINPDAAKNVSAAGAEEVILGLLLIYDEYRNSVASGETVITEEDFFTAFGRRVFSVVMELQKTDGGFSQALLGQFFNADEMGRIHRLILNRSGLENNSIDILREAVRLLKEKKQIVSAEKNGDKFASIMLKRKKAQDKKQKIQDNS
jgi:DNA primase